MTVIGYGRGSTKNQYLALQEETLKEYDCEKIFIEKQSGAKSNREELAKALDYFREGDRLVVYKLDRLARSTLIYIRLLRI
ncbi:recombinase family protein [Peribacillus frigoritolerans]